MPAYYPQYYYPANYPTSSLTQPSQPQIQPQVQPPIQNGGFVTVRSEEEAKSYPVGQGMSVTFKIEGKPIVIEKSMGYSQFETPKIDRYRLVKEEHEEQPIMAQNEPKKEQAEDSAIDDLKAEIEALWKEIETLKKKPVSKKKEVSDDTE